MNERILQLLITAKSKIGPGADAAKKAIRGFSVALRRQMQNARASAKKAADAFKKNWLGVTVAIFAIQRAFKGLANIVKGFGITVNATVENLKIRLNAALRSVSEGNILFKKMEDVAAGVAFEYREIIEAATILSGVFK